MGFRNRFWILTVVVVVALVGCSKAEPTPTPAASLAGFSEDTPGGFGDVNRLALGTLRLEGTEDAVTAAQAAELLPLWRMVQGGSLRSDAETNAVLKQIEGKMTESQLAAIETMELAGEDIQTWMQEQGVEMSARPGGQGDPGAFQNLSEEERAKMREEFQNMTAEERATRMAETGIQRPEGSPQGGGQRGNPGAGSGFGGAGRGNFLLGPLIELLTERAAG